MSNRDRSRSADSGVTIVEAAFAFPILLLFIFGLVDLGMWTFNSNQATNAARDGARAGILSFEDLDDPASPAHDRVEAAVEAHLDRQAGSISVSCVDPDGDPISCATARVDVDRVKVDVDWDWKLVTPVAAILGYDDGRAAGSATMSIVGLPYDGPPGATTTTTISPSTSTTATIPSETTTTTSALACSGGSLSVSPLTVKTTKSGSNQLVEELDFEFTTNGSALCDQLKIVLISPKDNGNNNKRETFTCGCGDGTTFFRGSYTGSTNIWGDTGGGWRAVLVNGDEVFDTEYFSVQKGD